MDIYEKLISTHYYLKYSNQSEKCIDFTIIMHLLFFISVLKFN